MITYVFLGIMGVWFVVSAIVGAFASLVNLQGVTITLPIAQTADAPNNALAMIGWLLNSVGFFFKMFTFTIPGAEAFSLIWVFMGIAWIYCLIRIIHTGGT